MDSNSAYPHPPSPFSPSEYYPTSLEEQPSDYENIVASGPSPALWYKTAILYQLHVRAFYDSNGDGIGDFAGLTKKLDYLQDLGITALWLLPFYPSPLKDDGYDISDYRGIHPSYGTLDDFREFLKEAHRRGLQVITELVLNHTSDQHPWFQRARRAQPGSPERNFYVWSDTSERYTQARVIFQDYESSNWSWDPVARAYYWHRFFLHQPDLNYDNPEVRRQIAEVLDYWLEMGVDGLRLDGVPYLYEREGTTCENLPETHEFLKSLRSHVDSRFSGRMFLAEANQWPEDAARYFGNGDECHTAFHFPVMPRMYLAIQMEDRFPIIDILEQTPSIPENCQWMLFLRNHDELTLEMVTEQERDAMYRFYARDPQARINLGIRRRLSPLLDNDRRKTELLNGLLLSLPGTPIIYYGDEIGMGDNIYLGDRNGVRTPMQWTADRNAGFSQANPQQLYLPPIIDYQYHYETVNVETLKAEPNSILSWMRRVIRLRRELRPLAEGALEFLHPDNHKVLAFLRVCESTSGMPPETVLVVANLSHSAQFVELDLSAHREKTPVEAFGRIRFPRIGELPYLLTLTPYAFYWFVLEAQDTVDFNSGFEIALPTLTTTDTWPSVFEPPAQKAFEKAISKYVSTMRLASHSFHRLHLKDVIQLEPEESRIDTPLADSRPEYSETPSPPPHLPIALLLAHIESETGEESTFAIPLSFSRESETLTSESHDPDRMIARLTVEHNRFSESGVIADCFHDSELCRRLLAIVKDASTLRGSRGTLSASSVPEFLDYFDEIPAFHGEETRTLEGTNSILVFQNRIVLKLFRRLEEGPHPEEEMLRHLAIEESSIRTAPLFGVLQYQEDNKKPSTLGVVEGFVEHDNTALDMTLELLDTLMANDECRNLETFQAASLHFDSLVSRARQDMPNMSELPFGDYLEAMQLLGRRTAELHELLAMDCMDPAFTPERLLPFHLRSLFQNVRNVLGRKFRLLRNILDRLSPPLQDLARQILAQGGDRLFPTNPHSPGLHEALREDIMGTRIRNHGNYGLEDVLCREGDFIFIDFEGDADLPITQRRMKSSPLRDVASMLWSLERAGLHALFEYSHAREIDAQEFTRLEARINSWNYWTTTAFLKSYLDSIHVPLLLPNPIETIQPLLNLHFAEKCVTMLRRDLNRLPHAGPRAEAEARLSLGQTLRLLTRP